MSAESQNEHMVLQAELDALHLPKDAGDSAEALRRILLRIPDGWGRWISCGPGWYPLLAALDTDLARISPTYTVQQVKEKYGTLRFYAEPGEESSPFEQHSPRPTQLDTDDDAAFARRLDDWDDAFDAWLASDEGRAWTATIDETRERFEMHIRAAETAAAQTCEVCGALGELRCTRGLGPWYQTYCATCAGDTYITIPEWKAWEAAEGPRLRRQWYEEDRARRLAEWTHATIVVASANPVAFLPSHERITTAAGIVERLERGGIDELWLADDVVAEAAVQWLAARYAGRRDALFADMRARGRTSFILTTPDGQPELYPLDRDARRLAALLVDTAIPLHHVHSRGDFPPYWAPYTPDAD